MNSLALSSIGKDRSAADFDANIAMRSSVDKLNPIKSVQDEEENELRDAIIRQANELRINNQKAERVATDEVLIHQADSRQIALEAAVAPVNMADGGETARSNH